MNKTFIARFPDYVIAAIALCLPLALLCLYSELLFPYVTSKVWVLRTLLLLGVGAALFSDNFLARFRLLIQQPLFLAACVYCIWALISNQLSTDPQRAFWSTYERLDGGLGVCFALLLLGYLFCTLDSMRRISSYLIALCLTLFTLAVIAIYQQDIRAASLLGNPIYLGSAMAMGVFVVGFSASRHLEMAQSVRRKRVVGGVSFLLVSLMLLALYNSGSRGPAAGLLAGLPVTGLSWWGFAKKPTLLKFGAVTIGVLLLCGASLWNASALLQGVQFEKGSLVHRLLLIPSGQQTTVDRLANWSIAIDVAKQRPIIGHGSEAYVTEFTKHYKSGVLDNADLWFDRAHNHYLDVLVAHGFVGLALFLFVLLTAAYLLAKRVHYTPLQRALLLGFLACYGVKNLVGFDALASQLLLFSVMAVIMLGSQRTLRPTRELTAHQDVLSWKVLKVTLCGFVVLVFYSLVVVPFQANVKMLQVSRLISGTATFNDPIGAARFKKIKAGMHSANKLYPMGEPEHLQAVYDTLSTKKQLSLEVLNMFYQQSRAIVISNPETFEFNITLGCC